MKKHDRKKEKKFAPEEQDMQNVERFRTSGIEAEKLKILSEISRDKYKLQALEGIPEGELYKYIGKLNEVDSILELLSRIKNLKDRGHTFSYLASQLKGNAIKYIQLLARIDFKTYIPLDMRVLKLNNLNGLTTDTLYKLSKHTVSCLPAFKINDNQIYYIDKAIEYTFEEMFAIVSKIEELTQGIKDTDSEEEKFRTIYDRITANITYDDEKSEQEDIIDRKDRGYYQKMLGLRHDTAGLYGGLVDGKSVCAGYALIFHEAAQYVRA